MSRARRGGRSAVTSIEYAAAPLHRVLVLGDGPDGAATELEDLVARHLAEPAPGAALDLVRSPVGALRVIAGDPHALARYDAVILLATPSSRRGRAVAHRVQAAAVAAVGIPLLLVELRTGDDERSGRAEEDPDGVLVLHALMGHQAAARRIAGALRALLPVAEPAVVTAVAPVVPTGPHGRRIDAFALRRLEQIARLTRDGLGAAAAEVDLVGRDHVVAIATAGARPSRTPRADSLCTLAVAERGSTVILDTRLHTAARSLRPAQGEHPIRFYAAHPLGSRSGVFSGALCVWDRSPRQTVRDLDLSLLRDLALLAEGEIADALSRTA